MSALRNGSYDPTASGRTFDRVRSTASSGAARRPLAGGPSTHSGTPGRRSNRASGTGSTTSLPVSGDCRPCIAHGGSPGSVADPAAPAPTTHVLGSRRGSSSKATERGEASPRDEEKAYSRCSHRAGETRAGRGGSPEQPTPSAPQLLGERFTPACVQAGTACRESATKNRYPLAPRHPRVRRCVLRGIITPIRRREK